MGPSQTSTLWWTYKKQLKMAIEIVDFPIKNGDFPLLFVCSPEGISDEMLNQRVQMATQELSTSSTSLQMRGALEGITWCYSWRLGMYGNGLPQLSFDKTNMHKYATPLGFFIILRPIFGHLAWGSLRHAIFHAYVRRFPNRSLQILRQNQLGSLDHVDPGPRGISLWRGLLGSSRNGE